MGKREETSSMLLAAVIAERYRKHNEEWNGKRARCRRLKNAYMTQYWDKENDESLIETSKGYEFVESNIASLFTKAPAVEVQADIRNKGNADIVKMLANNFLEQSRKPVLLGSKLASIYEAGYVKVVPKEHPDLLKRAKIIPIAPWNVMRDIDAMSWEDQKFVAHIDYITVAEAKERYNVELDGEERKYFLENKQPSESYQGRQDKLHREFMYIKIVEFYDFVGDRMVVWSPNYENGEKLLFDGMELLVFDEKTKADKVVKYNKIPFKDHSGYKISPIIPLYFAEEPECPLKGYSGLGRVYDQIQEINIVRTAQSQMVKKIARQWFFDQKAVDENVLNQLVAGDDGVFIGIDLPKGKRLQDVVMAVPHSPVPVELEQYLRQVKSDFDTGSILAPFTRGESSRATATEITALASYSSSEIGRMARERDAMIENIARVYISILRLFITEEGDSIMINGESTVIKPSHLDGDFKFHASDTGATPVADAVKKQEFINLVPTLEKLGVSMDVILRYVVTLFGLPQTFLSAVSGTTPTPTPTQEQQIAAMTAQGQIPSPQNIQAALPQGGQ